MFSLNRLRRSRRGINASEQRTLRERGAAALEFALVAPFFFAVVFGGIEIGFMFRSHLALEDMSRTAARVASVQRNSPDADKAILESINAQSQGLHGEVKKVVIFSAPTLDSEILDECKDASASLSDRCNVYEVKDRWLGNNGVQGIINNIGTFPVGLDAAQRSEWSNLGVYIEYEYPYLTGFLDSTTLSTSSVEVVELNL